MVSTMTPLKDLWYQLYFTLSLFFLLFYMFTVILLVKDNGTSMGILMTITCLSGMLIVLKLKSRMCE